MSWLIPTAHPTPEILDAKKPRRLPKRAVTPSVRRARICAEPSCGKPFLATFGGEKYCSPACREFKHLVRVRIGSITWLLSPDEVRREGIDD